MSEQPAPCDLLIRGAHVLTLDRARTTHPVGAIAIRGSTIAAVGPETEILGRYVGKETIDAQGAILHAGFVEPHIHINSTTCRGLFRGDAAKGGGKGPSFADWKASFEPADERATTMLGSLELLHHGFTTFLEPGSALEPDAVAEAASATGIRCSLADPYLWDDTRLLGIMAGLGSKALFDRVPPTRERCLKALGSQLRRNRDTDGTLHGHIATYGEGTASDELMQAAKAAADAAGVVSNTHIGFDIDIAVAMETAWGQPRFRRLAELGVLGPNVTVTHMNLIRDEEVAPILDSGMVMVWCPLVYMTKGLPHRQPTRLPEMRRRGAPVAIGTDATRMATVGDAGFLAFHLSTEVGAPLQPEDIVEMRTLAAARAMGLQSTIGSLEPGKRADLVIRDRRAVEMQPAVDPAMQLVAIAHGASADTVVVNGRIVMRDGRSTLVDEDEVFAAARASVTGVMRRLGM